jgi:hypothetical protein
LARSKLIEIAQTQGAPRSVKIQFQLGAIRPAAASRKGNDLPIFAIQDGLEIAVEDFSIGGRHQQAEGVVPIADQLSTNLDTRTGNKVRQQSSLAIFDRPCGRHDTRSTSIYRHTPLARMGM